MMNGNGRSGVPIHGEFDVPNQELEYEKIWNETRYGLVPMVTHPMSGAFIMHARVGRSKFQLYLYDASGVELETINMMKNQKHFPLMKGFVIMLDPLLFDNSVSNYSNIPTTLLENIKSFLIRVRTEIQAGKDDKIDMRVAVVLNKADLEFVKSEIGDIRREQISGETCRRAIVKLGGEQYIRPIEHHFKDVAYFACSPLGRSLDSRNDKPFKASGVLEPLYWILTGKNNN